MRDPIEGNLFIKLFESDCCSEVRATYAEGKLPAKPLLCKCGRPNRIPKDEGKEPVSPTSAIVKLVIVSVSTIGAPSNTRQVPERRWPRQQFVNRTAVILLRAVVKERDGQTHLSKSPRVMSLFLLLRFSKAHTRKLYCNSCAASPSVFSALPTVRLDHAT